MPSDIDEPKAKKAKKSDEGAAEVKRNDEGKYIVVAWDKIEIMESHRQQNLQQLLNLLRRGLLRFISKTEGYCT